MKLFSGAICYLFGHKWAKQSEIELSTGARGKGQIVWEKCSRCGVTRCRWVADVNLSKICEIAQEVTVKPRDLDVEAKVTKPKKARAKKAVAQAA